MKYSEIDKKVESLLSTPYLKMYDNQYQENKHYYIVSRRDKDDLIINKSMDEIMKVNPDGVGCVVIVNNEKLLLNYEYRYPIGQKVLSVPAGLIEKDEDILESAVREIKEETGLDVERVEMINPLMFSSPGMTDESNGMVLAFVKDDNSFSQDGCEESECFLGHCLLDKKEVIELLDKRCDSNGCLFSVYTLIAMLYFISDLWRK